METALKIIYISLMSTVPIIEIFFILFLGSTGKLLELIVIHIIGFVLAIFVQYFLSKILEKGKELKVYARELILILILIFSLTSYGVFNPSGLSISNFISLFGPGSLLAASFLVFYLGIVSINRIETWEQVGLKTTEVNELIRQIDDTLKEKNDEITWAYDNVRFLIIPFVTGQLNLILILLSDILEKLVNETFKTLEIPVPKNEKGYPVGFVKKIEFLEMNLILDDYNFTFSDFWNFRGKYIHQAISKSAKIYPPETEIKKCIQLFSKLLKEYPEILKKHLKPDSNH